MKIQILFFLLSLFLFSCEPQYKYDSWDLPSTPENLAGFNSSADDYNSTAPTLGRFIPLCFSSNRYSNGSQFDIIYEPMVVSFGKSTGEFRILNNYAEWGIYQHYGEVFQNALKQVNTYANELGPYFMINNSMTHQDYDYLLIFASDIDGNFDINFTFKRQQDSLFMESIPIDFINSEFDELYPFVAIDKGQFLFCSNRENEIFDIYSIDLNDPYDSLLEEFLYPSQKMIVKNNILSSDADDKCPYIYDNTMVFTSNRPGGYGGFDLYKSTYQNSEWTTPVNLGPNVNSEADEYRPILINEGVDPNKNMMIFSSNRSEGQGGFDLYYVGVNKE